MATVSYVTSLFRSHVLLLLLIVPFHIKVVQCTNDVIGGLQFELPDTKRTCFYEDFEHAGMYLFGYKVGITAQYVL